MTNKISAVFQRFHAVFQRKMPNSVGEPEVDLIDPEESCVPDPSAPEPEPEVESGRYRAIVCVPDPSVPEPEPEVDLIDPEESCVPDPSAPEPEPEVDLIDPEESCVPDPSAP